MSNQTVSRQSAVCALAALLTLSAFNTPAQDIAAKVKAELDPIFDAPTWRSGRWGVAVYDMTSNQLLYSRDLEKGFMPASNLKLYTTAATMETLGQDFKFETKLYASGNVNQRGVLRGDIVVVGSGDPSVSGRYIEDKPTTAILREWAAAVKQAGVKRIEGAVVGDDDAFDDESRTGSWQLDYYADWYAAENSGLTMNDNCWDVVITPGKRVGDPAVVTPQLPTKYVKFTSHVVTTPARGKHGDTSGADSTTATAAVADDLSSSTSDDNSPVNIEIARGLDNNDIVLSGTIPADYGAYKEWGSVHNGTLFAATMFAEELARQGVQVTGGPKDIDDLDAARASKLKQNRGKLIHTHISPPLSRIIAMINKPSQNFYADQLLKSLGAQTYGRGSYENGRHAVRDFLTTAGVKQTTTLRMVDGSGLSRQDMVEPQMTLALLQQMAKSKYAAAFEASLPIMGVDGTLKTRLRNTPAHKNVHAKTGTINSVRSLSGYLTTKGGHRLAFCMMANNFSAPTRVATAAQDNALLKLIALDEGTSATQTTDTSTSSTAPNN